MRPGAVQYKCYAPRVIGRRGVGEEAGIAAGSIAGYAAWPCCLHALFLARALALGLPKWMDCALFCRSMED